MTVIKAISLKYRGWPNRIQQGGSCQELARLLTVNGIRYVAVPSLQVGSFATGSE